MKRYIKSSKSNLVFENYGDANFLDGGCIIAKDGDAYRVVTCDYVYDAHDENRSYLIQECYVDINDTWIDRDAIESYADCNKDTEPEWYAQACVSYYGGQDFGAGFYSEDQLMTADEVEQYMKSHYNLPSDIYFG